MSAPRSLKRRLSDLLGTLCLGVLLLGFVLSVATFRLEPFILGFLFCTTLCSLFSRRHVEYPASYPPEAPASRAGPDADATTYPGS